jgi:hypothetical protein
LVETTTSSPPDKAAIRLARPGDLDCAAHLALDTVEQER